MIHGTLDVPPQRVSPAPISSILQRYARQGTGPAENATAQAVDKLALRPDIVNLTTHELYEIKPAGAEATAKALVAQHIARVIMLVPSFFHGRFREVKAACRRKVTQLKRGAQWHELAGELVDTHDYPGLLVVDGPSPLVGGGEHFHFFAIAQVIRDAVPIRLPQTTYIDLFEPAIHTNWGFLALLSQWSRSFIRIPDHQQRYLHLAVRWWDELDAEGPRYSPGVNDGRSLWELPSNLEFCLARQGLPLERFEEPVPEGGMAELVAETRAGLPPGPDELH